MNVNFKRRIELFFFGFCSSFSSGNIYLQPHIWLRSEPEQTSTIRFLQRLISVMLLTVIFVRDDKSRQNPLANVTGLKLMLIEHFTVGRQNTLKIRDTAFFFLFFQSLSRYTEVLMKRLLHT